MTVKYLAQVMSERLSHRTEESVQLPHSPKQTPLNAYKNSDTRQKEGCLVY